MAESGCGSREGRRNVPQLQEGERYSIFHRSKVHRLSLIHVRMTDAALQALEDYRHNKNNVSSQPSIQLEGRQKGCIKIPNPDQPSEVQKFNFNVSNVAKYNPQESFACVEQKDSSSEASQLSCLGFIQNNITLCETSDSYLATRKRVIQVEEDSCKQSAKFIEPCGPKLGRRLPVRRAPKNIPDAVPMRRRTAPVNPAYTVRRTQTRNIVNQWPYRDRVIHLLALKSYKKPELLSHLERDGISHRDKDSLELIFQQVADVNPKDNSYTLKDSVFKEIQRDWPGYSEIEKQSLESILSRKLNSPENAMSSNHLQHQDASCKDALPKSQKRLWNFSGFHPVMSKKQRRARITRQVQLSFRSQLFIARKKAAEARALSTPFPALATTSSAPPLPPMHLPPSNASTSEGQDTQGTLVECFSPNSTCKKRQWKHSSCVSWTPLEAHAVPLQPPGPSSKEPAVLQQKPKWLLKLLEKYNCKTEESVSKEKKDLSEKETAKLEKSCCLDSGVKETCIASEYPLPSASEQPDYLLKYVPIVSLEQRQVYYNDFSAEFDEYRSLYSQMESVTRIFSKLYARWKLLSPKSNEYQVLQEEILDEYQKLMKSSPNYYNKKQRCQYLHRKLSHIKGLIEDFDKRQAEPQP